MNTDSMVPLLRQMLEADDDRARAGILLRVPDMVLAKYRGGFVAACAKARFDAGEAFIAARIAAMWAVRDGCGRLPADVEMHLIRLRERFGAYASAGQAVDAVLRQAQDEGAER